MGESRSSKRYLLVRPGDANWSVVSSLKEEKRKKTKQEEEEKKEQDIFLESGGFLDMCPAHPLNAYNQRTGTKSWTSNATWEEDRILLRCSTHDAQHAKWLFKKGTECDMTSNKNDITGSWGKEEIAKIIWKADDTEAPLAALLDFEEQKEVAYWQTDMTNKTAHQMDQGFIQWLLEEASEGRWDQKRASQIAWKENNKVLNVSLLDLETQKKFAYWNQEETNRNAHLAGEDFVHWLIEQARKGKWPKKEVGSIACRLNNDNQLILATLDREVQREVSMFDPTTTCTVLHLMDQDFLQWVSTEAAKVGGSWDSQMVVKMLMGKEDGDENTNFTSKSQIGNI